VWLPAGAGPGAALPVLVWVHGGGYVQGGTSIPFYDGSAFARHGIVVVSVNYRLTRFGFFAHPAVTAGTTGPVANFGYLDQIAALEWVRDNVAAFGGDPARITLAGESAGGASVLHLLTSPLVDRLFHQAVVLSGGGREALIARPMSDGRLSDLTAPVIDGAFAVLHGIVGDGPDALAQLRALDPQVVAGDEDLEKLAELMLFGGGLPGVPVVDGKLVVGEPEDRFLIGDATAVPIVIGSTALDIPLHFPPNRVAPLEYFGEDEEAARAAYGVADPHLLDPEALVRLLLSIGADMTMHEPAHFVAASMQRAGCPAWVYRFTYTAESTRPDQSAQVHAGELPFLFDALPARYGDAVTDRDRASARAFHTYVANFVRTGDPNGDGLPAWPRVVEDEYDLMHFTAGDGPVFGPDPRPGVPLVARARARHRT
jgi:para-nitrobenzyl esterase